MLLRLGLGALRAETIAESVAVLHTRRFAMCTPQLFSLLLHCLWPAAQQADTVTLLAEMEDEAMQPFVFALCRRQDAQMFRSRHGDIGQYCKPPAAAAAGGLHPSLCVLTDCHELAAQLLKPGHVAVINEHVELFELAHFTDQAVSSSPDESPTEADGSPKLVSPLDHAHKTFAPHGVSLLFAVASFISGCARSGESLSIAVRNLPLPGCVSCCGCPRPTRCRMLYP